jgi:hypothetical protein
MIHAPLGSQSDRRLCGLWDRRLAFSALASLVGNLVFVFAAGDSLADSRALAEIGKVDQSKQQTCDPKDVHMGKQGKESQNSNDLKL